MTVRSLLCPFTRVTGLGYPNGHPEYPRPSYILVAKFFRWSHFSNNRRSHWLSLSGIPQSSIRMEYMWLLSLPRFPILFFGQIGFSFLSISRIHIIVFWLGAGGSKSPEPCASCFGKSRILRKGGCHVFIWMFICFSPQTRNEGISPSHFSAHIYIPLALSNASPNYQVSVSYLLGTGIACWQALNSKHCTAFFYVSPAHLHSVIWFDSWLGWLSSPVNRSTPNLCKKVPHCGPALPKQSPLVTGECVQRFSRLLRILGKVCNPLAFVRLSLTSQEDFFFLLLVLRSRCCVS